MSGFDRRRFINWFLGTSVGAMMVSTLYPVLRFMSPPEIPEAGVHEIDAGATNDPDFLDRGFRIIRFGAEPVIVLRVAENDFRAFAGAGRRRTFRMQARGGPVLGRPPCRDRPMLLKELGIDARRRCSSAIPPHRIRPFAAAP